MSTHYNCDDSLKFISDDYYTLIRLLLDLILLIHHLPKKKILLIHQPDYHHHLWFFNLVRNSPGNRERVSKAAQQPTLDIKSNTNLNKIEYDTHI